MSLKKIILFLLPHIRMQRSLVSWRERPVSVCSQTGRQAGQFEASLSPDFPLLQRLSALTSDPFALYWTYWSRTYSKPALVSCFPNHTGSRVDLRLSSAIECYHPLWHVMDMPWPRDIWCSASNFPTMHSIKLTIVFCLKEPNLCYRKKYRDSNYRFIRNETTRKTSVIGKWRQFSGNISITELISWKKRERRIP